MTSNDHEGNKKMDEQFAAKLKYLRLRRLLSEWDEYLDRAKTGRYSCERFLKFIVEEEYAAKRESSRLLRRQRANIPELLEMETFPFSKQPKLDRKKIVSLYDRFDYMEKQRNLIFMGPTGCGKTGLATAFLLNAVDRGYRGLFVSFPNLINELFQSIADHTEHIVIKRYLKCDCLVIDEVGYVEVEPAQVGQFFTLMSKRHRKATTIITSNLGFSDWNEFLHNKQLTAALIDRLTSSSHVINMKNCKSIRPPLDGNENEDKDKDE